KLHGSEADQLEYGSATDGLVRAVNKKRGGAMRRPFALAIFSVLPSKFVLTYEVFAYRFITLGRRCPVLSWLGSQKGRHASTSSDIARHHSFYRPHVRRHTVRHRPVLLLTLCSGDTRV